MHRYHTNKQNQLSHLRARNFRSVASSCSRFGLKTFLQYTFSVHLAIVHIKIYNFCAPKSHTCLLTQPTHKIRFLCTETTTHRYKQFMRTEISRMPPHTTITLNKISVHRNHTQPLHKIRFLCTKITTTHQYEQFLCTEITHMTPHIIITLNNFCAPKSQVHINMINFCAPKSQLI